MWSDMDTLLLLEGLELFGDNWAEISDHVGTKSQVHLLGRKPHSGQILQVEQASGPNFPFHSNSKSTIDFPFYRAAVFIFQSMTEVAKRYLE